MKKYVLMLVGIIGVSVLGGIGVIYSFVRSAPMHVSRIELDSNTPAAQARSDTALANSGTNGKAILVH